MPRTTIYFYAEQDGHSSVAEWLLDLRRFDKRGFTVCRARLTMLAMLGHELRRPYADLLRDGIYELRARAGNVNDRILYFFHGKDIAVAAHGITKEREVPGVEIDRALERKRRYEQNPQAHQSEIS